MRSILPRWILAICEAFAAVFLFLRSGRSREEAHEISQSAGRDTFRPAALRSRIQIGPRRAIKIAEPRREGERAGFAMKFLRTATKCARTGEIPAREGLNR
jgi:hypothetical protein